MPCPVSPGHRRVSSRHTDGVTSSRFEASFLLEIGRITRFSVHRCARSGAQGKSELFVQRAVSTSNHCRRHEAGTLQPEQIIFGNRIQGLLMTPCLIETQFSQSLVGMVPFPLFQHVPNRPFLS